MESIDEAREMEKIDQDSEMLDIQVPKVLTNTDCLTDTDNEVPVASDDTGATSKPALQTNNATNSSSAMSNYTEEWNVEFQRWLRTYWDDVQQRYYRRSCDPSTGMFWYTLSFPPDPR
jgi:hypothetical protein